MIGHPSSPFIFSNPARPSSTPLPLKLFPLLPYLQEKTDIISIIGNKKSPIGMASDCILDGSVEREACPINLLPTASTTVALALGDALVTTLARSEGLNPEKFADFNRGW